MDAEELKLRLSELIKQTKISQLDKIMNWLNDRVREYKQSGYTVLNTLHEHKNATVDKTVESVGERCKVCRCLRNDVSSTFQCDCGRTISASVTISASLNDNGLEDDGLLGRSPCRQCKSTGRQRAITTPDVSVKRRRMEQVIEEKFGERINATAGSSSGYESPLDMSTEQAALPSIIPNNEDQKSNKENGDSPCNIVVPAAEEGTQNAGHEQISVLNQEGLKSEHQDAGRTQEVVVKTEVTSHLSQVDSLMADMLQAHKESNEILPSGFLHDSDMVLPSVADTDCAMANGNSDNMNADQMRFSSGQGKTRKSKYLSSYLPAWETEFNREICWLQRSFQEGHAFCLICNREILIKHMGKSAILQHMKGRLHRNRFEHLLSTTQQSDLMSNGSVEGRLRYETHGDHSLVLQSRHAFNEIYGYRPSSHRRPLELMDLSTAGRSEPFLSDQHSSEGHMDEDEEDPLIPEEQICNEGAEARPLSHPQTMLESLEEQGAGADEHANFTGCLAAMSLFRREQMKERTRSG